ncbi:MAG: hypothetical protein MJ244_00505 [Clostridia bacterium]|nr:hypothetical protein [Clostridia bacterium]
MKNYNGSNYYSYNSNLAYNERYYEREVNNFDVRVEKTRGLSKSKPKMAVVSVFLVSLIVVAVFAFLFQYVQCCTLDHNIELRKTEIKHIEDQIIDTDVKIAENLDAAYIKKIAIGKLGMVEANDSQKVYIETSHEDATISY